MVSAAWLEDSASSGLAKDEGRYEVKANSAGGLCAPSTQDKVFAAIPRVRPRMLARDRKNVGQTHGKRMFNANVVTS